MAVLGFAGIVVASGPEGRHLTCEELGMRKHLLRFGSDPHSAEELIYQARVDSKATSLPNLRKTRFTVNGGADLWATEHRQIAEHRVSGWEQLWICRKVN